MDVSNLLRQPTTSVVEGVAAPPKYRCGGAFLPQSNRSSAALLAGSLAALCEKLGTIACQRAGVLYNGPVSTTSHYVLTAVCADVVGDEETRADQCPPASDSKVHPWKSASAMPRGLPRMSEHALEKMEVLKKAIQCVARKQSSGSRGNKHSRGSQGSRGLGGVGPEASIQYSEAQPPLFRSVGNDMGMFERQDHRMENAYLHCCRCSFFKSCLLCRVMSSSTPCKTLSHPFVLNDSPFNLFAAVPFGGYQAHAQPASKDRQS
eukprot:18499-Rhodomonas_salina.1